MLIKVTRNVTVVLVCLYLFPTTVVAGLCGQWWEEYPTATVCMYDQCVVVHTEIWQERGSGTCLYKQEFTAYELRGDGASFVLKGERPQELDFPPCEECRTQDVRAFDPKRKRVLVSNVEACLTIDGRDQCGLVTITEIVPMR